MYGTSRQNAKTYVVLSDITNVELDNKCIIYREPNVHSIAYQVGYKFTSVITTIIQITTTNNKPKNKQTTGMLIIGCILHSLFTSGL